MKTCVEFHQFDFPIKLQQRGKDCFRVVYGKQIDDGLTYNQACTELGAALMHALACGGRLDNRMKGER